MVQCLHSQPKLPIFLRSGDTAKKRQIAINLKILYFPEEFGKIDTKKKQNFTLLDHNFGSRISREKGRISVEKSRYTERKCRLSKEKDGLLRQKADFSGKSCV